MLYFLAYYKKRKRQRQNWLYIQDRWLVKPSMSLRHGSATTTKLPLSREYNEESLVHDYTLSSSIVLKRSRFELDHVTFNTPSQREPPKTYSNILCILHLLLLPLLVLQTHQLTVVGVLDVVEGLGEHIRSLVKCPNVSDINLPIIHSLTNKVVANINVLAPAVLPRVFR